MSHGDYVELETDPRVSWKATLSLALGLASILFSLLAAVPAFIFACLALIEIGNNPASLTGRGRARTGLLLAILIPLSQIGLVIGGIALWRSGALLPADPEQDPEVALVTSQLNRVGNGLLSHYEYYDAFPQIDGSEETKRNLSWRVHLLPYVGENSLYEKFQLADGWQGTVNRQLAREVPVVYRRLNHDASSESTQVLTPVSRSEESPERLGIERGANRTFLGDPDSLTAMVVEGTDATIQGPWTMGYDLEVDSASPRNGLEERAGVYVIVMVDGSVKLINASNSDDVIYRILVRNDGLPVSIVE